MEPRDRFSRLISRPDGEIPLAEAALCIAAEARPDLDMAHYLEEIDRLADCIRPPVQAASTDAERVALLNHALFVNEGFTGNRTDYGDPENSFLDAVLERRTGIPITLSVLYVEIARRLGLDAHGIGFPGHFLAKVETHGGEIIVDAFFGCTLSLEDCADRLREVAGDAVRLEPAMLEAAGSGQILRRILTNLKRGYVQRSEFEPALGCCDRILLLAPDDPAELRDRGLVLRELECFGPALADLERFLAMAPGDRSAPAVRTALADLRTRAGQIH